MYGGKIDQVDTPLNVYATPATRFVGGFIGNPPMNFIKVRAEHGTVRIGPASFAAPTGGSELDLGLRGEDAHLSGDGSGLPFDVRVVEPMGSHLLLTGSIEGQAARIVAPPTAIVRAGERVSLSVDPSRLTWIDTSTGRALARP
jgi:multiple sugar transport system ATP-binding protein